MAGCDAARVVREGRAIMYSCHFDSVNLEGPKSLEAGSGPIRRTMGGSVTLALFMLSMLEPVGVVRFGRHTASAKSDWAYL